MTLAPGMVIVFNNPSSYPFSWHASLSSKIIRPKPSPDHRPRRMHHLRTTLRASRRHEIEIKEKRLGKLHLRPMTLSCNIDLTPLVGNPSSLHILLSSLFTRVFTLVVALRSVSRMRCSGGRVKFILLQNFVSRFSGGMSSAAEMAVIKEVVTRLSSEFLADWSVIPKWLAPRLASLNVNFQTTSEAYFLMRPVS